MASWLSARLVDDREDFLGKSWVSNKVSYALAEADIEALKSGGNSRFAVRIRTLVNGESEDGLFLVQAGPDAAVLSLGGKGAIEYRGTRLASEGENVGKGVK